MRPEYPGLKERIWLAVSNPKLADFMFRALGVLFAFFLIALFLGTIVGVIWELMRVIWLLFVVFQLPGVIVAAWAIRWHRAPGVPMSLSALALTSEMKKRLTKRGWVLYVTGTCLWLGGLLLLSIVAGAMGVS